MCNWLKDTKEFISKASLLSLLSFPLVGNPSSKKDCGQAAMTERETECITDYAPKELWRNRWISLF
jgi:hypothetical protein